jgi:hypothetical protein
MSDQKIPPSGAPLAGSDEYEAHIAAHKAWSQKLAEDLVAALNKHTKEHGYDNVPDLTPVDPVQLAAMLAADKSC